jgi:hypothetical protein
MTSDWDQRRTDPWLERGTEEHGRELHAFKERIQEKKLKGKGRRKGHQLRRTDILSVAMAVDERRRTKLGPELARYCAVLTTRVSQVSFSTSTLDRTTGHFSQRPIRSPHSGVILSHPSSSSHRCCALLSPSRIRTCVTRHGRTKTEAHTS